MWFVAFATSPLILLVGLGENAKKVLFFIFKSNLYPDWSKFHRMLFAPAVGVEA